MKPVQHSYSTLTMFESCPKRYWHIKRKKDVKDSTSEVGNYGLDAHKHFENRLLKGKELPMDLEHHEPRLAKIAEAPGTGMPEQKLALNKDLQPTGFFDNDVWVRSVIDYVKVNDDRAIVIDHKFGKLRPGFDQIELCVAVFSCYRPQVTRYTGAFYWAKEKKLTSIRIPKQEITRVWEKFLPRFHRLEQAAEEEKFPAQPNGLCKRHCPVKACPYNGE